MIRGDRRYRITGTRGTIGLPRPAGAGGHGDDAAPDGRLPQRHRPATRRGRVHDRGVGRRTARRTSAVRNGSRFRPTPRRSWSASTSATPPRRWPPRLHIETLDAQPPQPPTDSEVAEQFTAMAWTLMKLTTLHRTIKPELLETPNVLLTAQAADLGAADTTPDNLYMIGTFGLADDETLLLEITPPDTRYWNVTLENIWHECIEPRRRHSSVTNKGVTADADGKIRIAIGAKDFGHGHWLDTGGHRRGFVVLRWLDNPAAPDVTVSVRKDASK